MFLKRWWYDLKQTVSPKYFYSISERFIPWLSVLVRVVGLVVGTVWVYLYAYRLFLQGAISYRIIFYSCAIGKFSNECLFVVRNLW